MKLSEAFRHYTDSNLSLVGLCLFLFVFFGWVFWVSLKANKKKYAHLATYLLEDGELK